MNAAAGSPRQFLEVRQGAGPAILLAQVLWRVPRRGIRSVFIEIANDLAYWQAEVPGRVWGRVEALTGPTTPPGKRVQSLNLPGAEVGPSGTVATWARQRTCGQKVSVSSGAESQLVKQTLPVRLERA